MEAKLISVRGREITIDIDGTTYVRRAADHVTVETLDAHVEALIAGLLIEHAVTQPLPPLGA